jgi:hypothetical protein
VDYRERVDGCRIITREESISQFYDGFSDQEKNGLKLLKGNERNLFISDKRTTFILTCRTLRRLLFNPSHNSPLPEIAMYGWCNF